MDQVIQFNKSFQERLSEYDQVLTGFQTFPLFLIKSEWSFHLSLVLDPVGWQAIWKIDRQTCESFNIPYPSIVLVIVLNVNFDELNAFVKILAVQDEIHLPEKYHVALINLYPTEGQDKSVVLDLKATANTLDMLRFFYRNLVMPWDYLEEEEGSDWKALHLESRLRLFYDMKTGVIPKFALEHLEALLAEAKHLQSKREIIINEMKMESDDEENSETVEKLVENHLRLLEVKFEVEIIENPLLRAAAIKQLKSWNPPPKNDATARSIWMVHEEALIDDYISSLNRIKTKHPNEKIRISHDLGTALETGSINDTYILNTGTYKINNQKCGIIEFGGHLKGLVDDPAETVIISKLDGALFDFKSGEIVLENLTINAITAQIAMIIRNASVTIKNCRIFGDGRLASHRGIVVLAGGQLEIINSQIYNFSTNIVGNTGAKILINSSQIYNGNFGLKVYDQCEMKISETSIRNCKCFGICVETGDGCQKEGCCKIADFDSLNILPQIDLKLVNGTDNHRGNAAINRKLSLKPFENVFDNSDLDLTIHGSSDEEMNDYVQNRTLVAIDDNRTSPATI